MVDNKILCTYIYIHVYIYICTDIYVCLWIFLCSGLVRLPPHQKMSGAEGAPQDQGVGYSTRGDEVAPKAPIINLVLRLRSTKYDVGKDHPEQRKGEAGNKFV